MKPERMNDVEKMEKTGNKDYYIMLEFCNGLIKGMGGK